MNLDLISFGLAMLVGLLAFWLVKHTADEFDRWYEDGSQTIRLRVPTVAASLALVCAAALFVLVH